MIFLAIASVFVATIITMLVVFANMMQSAPGKFWGADMIAIAWVISLINVLCWAAPAYAHDHNHPERNEWLKSLHSKDKTWCCDGNDTDAIDDWETKGNKFRVKFRGEWFDVPESALVDGPNKGGGALLWMNRGYMGLSVRCFMPGTLS